MKTGLLSFFIFITSLLSAQSKVQVDVASPKPSITIDGVNCAIGNTIYSCTPKTCNPVTIMQGDSVEFCTNNEIYLNTDTAYWMQWNFTGSTNYPSAVNDTFPSNTPICYYPHWTVAGNYTVDIYYNGWLSAYPYSDCYSFGPSHWIVNVIVQSATGISPTPEHPGFVIFHDANEALYHVGFTHPENVSAVKVIDLYGKEIPASIANDEIDLRNFPAGIYFLEFMLNDRMVVKKLVRE